MSFFSWFSPVFWMFVLGAAGGALVALGGLWRARTPLVRLGALIFGALFFTVCAAYALWGV